MNEQYSPTLSENDVSQATSSNSSGKIFTTTNVLVHSPPSSLRNRMAASTSNDTIPSPILRRTEETFSESGESTSGCSSLIPQMDRFSQFRHSVSSVSENAISSCLLAGDRHLPKLNSTSMSRHQPSFDSSLFATSKRLSRSMYDRRSLSPFYSGRTMYGGASVASSYSSLNRNRNRPYPAVSNSDKSINVFSPNTRNTVQPVTTPKSSSQKNVVLSTTAQKILDTIDRFSSPIIDARRIPVNEPVSKRAGTPMPSRIVKKRKLLPSLADTVVPSTPDLLRLKRKEKLELQNSTSAAREISNVTVIAEKREDSDSSSDDVEYTLNTNNNKSGYTNKIRNKDLKKNKFDDRPVDMIKLPNAVLNITTLPKIDISLCKPDNNSTKLHTTVTSNTLDLTDIFKFSKPVLESPSPENKLQPPSFKASCAGATSVATVSAVSANLPLTVSSEKSSSNHEDRNTAFKWEQSSKKDATFFPSLPTKSNTALPSFSFGTAHSDSADKKDSTCSVTVPNDSSITKRTSDNVETRMSQSKYTKWKCASCFLDNPSTREVCAGCSLRKKSADEKKEAETRVPKFDGPALTPVSSDKQSNWGGLFKPPSSDTWECKECFIRNSKSVEVCAACQTPKPGSKTTDSGSAPNTATSIFKFGSVSSTSSTAAPSPFSQLAKKRENSTKSDFAFGNIPEKTDTAEPALKPTFSFGFDRKIDGDSVTSSGDNTPQKPKSYLFGSDPSTNAQKVFSFGLNDSSSDNNLNRSKPNAVGENTSFGAARSNSPKTFFESSSPKITAQFTVPKMEDNTIGSAPSVAAVTVNEPRQSALFNAIPNDVSSTSPANPAKGFSFPSGNLAVSPQTNSISSPLVNNVEFKTPTSKPGSVVDSTITSTEKNTQKRKANVAFNTPSDATSAHPRGSNNSIIIPNVFQVNSFEGVFNSGGNDTSSVNAVSSSSMNNDIGHRSPGKGPFSFAAKVDGNRMRVVNESNNVTMDSSTTNAVPASNFNAFSTPQPQTQSAVGGGVFGRPAATTVNSFGGFGKFGSPSTTTTTQVSQSNTFQNSFSSSFSTVPATTTTTAATAITTVSGGFSFPSPSQNFTFGNSDNQLKPAPTATPVSASGGFGLTPSQNFTFGSTDNKSKPATVAPFSSFAAAPKSDTSSTNATGLFPSATAAAPSNSLFGMNKPAQSATTMANSVFTFGQSNGASSAAPQMLFGSPASSAFNAGTAASKPTMSFGETPMSAPKSINFSNLPSQSSQPLAQTNSTFGSMQSSTPFNKTNNVTNAGFAAPVNNNNNAFSFKSNQNTTQVPTFNPTIPASFNFTGGHAPTAFTAQPSMKSQIEPRKIKKAVRKSQR